MIRPLALAAFASTLAVAPAVAETVTIDTYIGSAEVATAPETVAVFDIAALDTLDALGLKADGVVAPLFVDYVADAAEDAAPLGSLFEPDFEAVAAMQPDLIIAGGRSSKQVPTLTELAPTIDMTIWEDTIGQGLARLDAYGRIFGKEAEAADLAAGLNAKIDEAKAAVAGQGNALIVMTNGPKVSAYGAGGRFGWLHTALDLPEAVADVEQATHGEAISFEFIRDADPDIMIVIDRMAAIGQEGDAAAATLDNALVHETAAWKNGRVIYLDSAPIYIAGGGVQSLNLTLDSVIAAFAGG
ncbi:MAG: siderophore ABC transporter substrate-binding protein [Pseudomonadota bacterium]